MGTEVHHLHLFNKGSVDQEPQEAVLTEDGLCMPTLEVYSQSVPTLDLPTKGEEESEAVTDLQEESDLHPTQEYLGILPEELETSTENKPWDCKCDRCCNWRDWYDNTKL